jgi:hypothetical protein
VLTRLACTVAVMAGMSTGPWRALAETTAHDHQTGRCLIVHSTLKMDHQLRAIAHAMWHRSPTFRRQVARLSQQTNLDTQLNVCTRPSGQWRAETQLRHGEGALRTATVRITMPNRAATIVELIAHELEHIVEQLDGVDLPRTATRSDASGVYQTHGGRFETERARRVGLIVQAEYLHPSNATACTEVQP